MEIVKLAVEVREKTGTAENRRLRARGRLPIVLYGMDRPNGNFTIDSHRFGLEYRRGRRMFELTLGDKTQVSLLKDVGFDHLGDTPVHVDFIRIDDSKPVTVSVAIEFIGTPSPVTGAVMDYVNRDVHVTCLPREIPESVSIHIGHLTVGDHIEAGQIKLPEGVKLADAPGRTIASYHYKHVETPVAAVVEGAAPAEPEVLTERKPTPEELAAEKKDEKKKDKEDKKK